MKVLLSMDEHVYCLNGEYYVRELGVDLINRYLKVFETMRLAVRVDYVEQLDSAAFSRIDSSRVEVYPLPFFRGYIQYIKHFAALRRQYRTVIGDCKLVIVRLPFTSGFSIASRALKQGIPLGCEVVANPYDFYKVKKPGISKVLYGIYHLQLKQICQKADAVAYVTRFALQRRYPALKKGSFTTHYSSARIPAGFYTQARELRSSDSYVLAHVAHPINNHEKGHALVIRVVAELNKRLPVKVLARFAGDGDLVDELKQLALRLGVSDKVEFPGLLSAEELYSLLKAADVMILPTLTEGLPRVLIEAMATGLPCVATPVGGIPELLDKESMFEPEDVSGFTERIARLLTDAELYKQESSRNFERSKDYEDDKLQEKRNNFYRRLRDLVKK